MSWAFAVPERSLVLPGAMAGVTVLRDPAPKGLTGLAPVRTHDVERHVAPGNAPGPDVFGPRLIAIPLDVAGSGTTEAAQRDSAMVNARPVLVAWRPQRSGVVSLVASMPGLPEPSLTFYGRCRGVEEADWTWTFGHIRLGLNFEATDPYGYGALRVLTAASGSFAVGPTGDPGAESRRVTLTVHGNGGTPLLINSAAPGQNIGFTTTVAGGTAVTLDLHAMTATSAGSDVASWLDGANRWFPLVGGAVNTLTLTGAASVDVTWQPAYL